MSKPARKLAHIVDAEPPGIACARCSWHGPSLLELEAHGAETHGDTPSVCSDCREPTYWDATKPPELVGGKCVRIRHLRTGLFACSPLCTCGQPAKHGIGSDDGFGFRVKRFVCAACDDGAFRIERIS